MVLNHIAAVLLFSGPVLWIGLWMVVDPAGIVELVGWPVQLFRDVVSGTASEGSFEVKHVTISRRLRRAVRFAGVALLLFAIAI
jgi:hypothetical protein